MPEAILATVSATAAAVTKDPLNWARTAAIVKTAVETIRSFDVDESSAIHVLSTGLDDLYAFAILDGMRRQS